MLCGIKPQSKELTLICPLEKLLVLLLSGSSVHQDINSAELTGRVFRSVSQALISTFNPIFLYKLQRRSPRDTSTIEIKQQNFLRFYWFSTGCLVTKNKIKTNFNKNMAIVVEKRLHFTKFSINLITTQLNKHTRLHVHRKTGLCSTRNLLIIRLFRAYILIRKYQRVKHFFTAWNSSCDLSI